MRYLLIALLSAYLLLSCSDRKRQANGDLSSRVLTREELLDKIKGGWAGQVIGCTYGGPTEFRYPGSMIHDYHPIVWDSSRISWHFEHSPGLYDDVYMDLTFVEVMENEGIDAPAASHAKAFANAGYYLWHANQAARYNILNGIMPPESGHWKNNPHAEDIDFQIEADFAGLMSPGMPNTASEICDRVGHIMNYGEGWYGGVYIAAMYSLAFISRDVGFVVSEGLKAIPPESPFRQCIQAVIDCCNRNPDDWKEAWFEVERNWAEDVGCPDGVFRPFNIDARVNAAYVVIGLLYGRGDYGKTLEIATRCGQDSDCNPASAGGILGTLLGFSNLPPEWRDPVLPIQDKPFPYTSMSLNRVYETSLKHALELIIRNGGKADQETITIAAQEIRPVRLEVNFPGIKPVTRKILGMRLETETEILFDGTGFALTGGPARTSYGNNDPFVFQVEMILDDQPAVNFPMPVSYVSRKHEVAWAYGLEEGTHRLKLKILNPVKGEYIGINDLITYQPDNKIHAE